MYCNQCSIENDANCENKYIKSLLLKAPALLSTTIQYPKIGNKRNYSYSLNNNSNTDQRKRCVYTENSDITLMRCFLFLSPFRLYLAIRNVKHRI